MTETEIAYIAGFLDGEGSFMIYLKAGGKNRHRKFHRAVVAVANTDRPIIDFLQERLGGRIATTVPKQENRRTVYHLVIEGTVKVKPLIEALLPHLRVKKHQAELVLEMLGTMTRNTGLPLPPEVLAKRDAIYERYVAAKHGPNKSWGGRKLA